MLHDIDAERREVVGGMAGRMLARDGFEGSLVVTDDLDAAVDGASFVVLQLRVGGQEARLADETIPLACGCIGQETTGAGGFAKAMRTVPVVLAIAERVRALAAPDAWIVDFTNPVGIVTRALLDAGHRAVGLCNVAIGIQRTDRAPARDRARARARRPGRAQPPDLGPQRARRRRGGAARPARGARRRARRAGGPAAAADRGARRDPVVLPPLLLRARRGARGAARRAFRARPTVARIERELLELYRDPQLAEKPALLEQRGGAFYSEAATALIASLAAGTGDVQVVDVRNGGTIARPRGRRRRRAAGADRRARPCAAPAAAARAGAARPRPARRGVRAAHRRGGRDARPGDGAEGAARAPADRPGRAHGRAASSRCALDEPASSSGGAR